MEFGALGSLLLVFFVVIPVLSLFFGRVDPSQTGSIGQKVSSDEVIGMPSTVKEPKGWELEQEDYHG